MFQWFSRNTSSLPSRAAAKQPLNYTYTRNGRGYPVNPLRAATPFFEYNGYPAWNQQPIWGWPHTYDNISAYTAPVIYNVTVVSGAAGLRNPNPLYNMIQAPSASVLG